MPGRAVWGAVGVVLLALVCSACGGGTGGSPSVVATAAETTTATTARVRTTTISVDKGDRTGRGVTLYSTGLVDFAGGDSSAVMATDGAGASSTLETRTVHGQTYLRIERGAWLPAGSAPQARDYPPALAVLTGAGALGGASPDPAQWLGILDDLADVREEGRARLDGVETTKYRGTFDLHAELAKSRRGRRLGVSDRGPSDIDVWIDGAGRVRRLVVAIPGQHGPVLIRTDLSNFGVPVRVTAPSPSEVLHIAPAPLPEGA